MVIYMARHQYRTFWPRFKAIPNFRSIVKPVNLSANSRSLINSQLDDRPFKHHSSRRQIRGDLVCEQDLTSCVITFNRRLSRNASEDNRNFYFSRFKFVHILPWFSTGDSLPAKFSTVLQTSRSMAAVGEY